MFGSVINKSRPWVRRPFWIKRLEKPMTLRRYNEIMFAVGIGMGVFFMAATLGAIEIVASVGFLNEGPSLAHGAFLSSIGVLAMAYLAWAIHREAKKIHTRYALVDTAAEAEVAEA